MPAVRTQQYGVKLAAAETSRPTTAVPNRKSLFIQNTSVNPGLFRFDGAPRQDGSDILFSSGQVQRWDIPDTCPTDSLNFFSTLATTWCVIEGVEVKG